MKWLYGSTHVPVAGYAPDDLRSLTNLLRKEEESSHETDTAARRADPSADGVAPRALGSRRFRVNHWDIGESQDYATENRRLPWRSTSSSRLAGRCGSSPRGRQVDMPLSVGGRRASMCRSRWWCHRKATTTAPAPGRERRHGIRRSRARGRIGPVASCQQGRTRRRSRTRLAGECHRRALNAAFTDAGHSWDGDVLRDSRSRLTRLKPETRL